MDPILLPRLLDGIHIIEQSEELISKQKLQQELNCSPRRLAEFLRVLTSSSLVSMNDDYVTATNQFKKFVAAWNEADVLVMNDILSQQKDYKNFLLCMQAEKSISLPTSVEEETRLGSRLHHEYNITFPAFDTFRRWGFLLATVYTVHLTGSEVIWAGAKPHLPEFEVVVKESWQQCRSNIDYVARLGDVAEITCKSLEISLQYFETMFTQMLLDCGDNLFVSGSALRPKARNTEIQLLRPRNEAVREVAALDTLPQWIYKRFLEDGIVVRGKYLRLIRWRN